MSSSPVFRSITLRVFPPGPSLGAQALPDVSARVAECSFCHATRPSSFDLPLFVHCPDWERDRFYCGCRGDI